MKVVTTFFVLTIIATTQIPCWAAGAVPLDDETQEFKTMLTSLCKGLVNHGCCAVSEQHYSPVARVVEELSVQLNATNLLDEQYVSTIGSNGFPNSDASGTNQTLLAGAPRQVFITIDARF